MGRNKKVTNGRYTSFKMVCVMALIVAVSSRVNAESSTKPVTEQAGAKVTPPYSDHPSETFKSTITPIGQAKQVLDTSCKKKLNTYTGKSNTRPNIDKSNIALLLLVGFGGFSLVIAKGYRLLRKYVYRDSHNLDTVFDAGGRVTTSLTAVTVTSQLLWPSSFVHNETLTSKSGLGGNLWMATGIVIDIILFPFLSLYLKTRAPGAKTYPQIAFARFGKAAHVLFCFVALLTNLIVATSMMLAGRTTIEVLSKDSNNEFIFLLMAVLFGSYCLIGGLGTTFYISYFNTALTFLSVSVYILYTSFYPSSDIEDITLSDRMYEKVRCLEGPDGNYDNSFLTFRSSSGLIYCVVLLFMATSTSFCDQANWQSRIATKPTQGVVGYLLSAYLWFVLPTSLSFPVTMSYMSMSAVNGTHLLTNTEIDNGYITPFVMDALLGDTGSYLFLTMMMMAIMSTGSGEVMAVSSIIVYDIFKTHINPFRKDLSFASCILCGKEKMNDTKIECEMDFCVCPSVIGCEACKRDVAKRSSDVNSFVIRYKCGIHGKYRQYEDGLMRYKTWCMALIVVAIVPYGLVISETSININWVTLGMTVFTSPFLIPLFLTITWSKATSKGIISGSVIGLACSITAMLIGGSMYEGGLSNFFVNTVEDLALLSAMLSGFVISGIITIGVSLCTHTIKTNDDEAREWAKTINIDNPLNPFRLVYKEELEGIQAGQFITANTMGRIFRKAKVVAVIGGCISLAFFLIIIPSIVLNIGTLSMDQFRVLINIFQYCSFGATILVVCLPPVEEWIQIKRKLRQNKETQSQNE